jgi:uncharacterized membrane protein YcaP (DUF421 family)
METVLRCAAIYFFLLIVFRVSGKRTLSEMSSFEFVVLLIISETTQQALIDSDHSITNAAVAILTLIGLSIVLSMLKQRFPSSEPVLEGIPVLLVENGHLQLDRMKQARVGKDDILEAARHAHGLERLDQIKYAVLEISGGITIIPWSR